MGEYHDARDELKGLILPLLSTEAKGKGFPDSPEVVAMLDERVEKVLGKFERVAIAHHRRHVFWSGVWQSFVGSLLFLLALTLFALLIYGFKQNPFRVLIDDMPIKQTQKIPNGSPP